MSKESHSILLVSGLNALVIQDASEVLTVVVLVKEIEDPNVDTELGKREQHHQEPTGHTNAHH